MASVTLEEALPLTVGDESEYRKDETGQVSHEKVNTGAVKTQSGFKISKPTLSGRDFVDFVVACKEVATTGSAPSFRLTAEQRAGLSSDNSNPIVRFFSNKKLDDMTQQS